MFIDDFINGVSEGIRLGYKYSNNDGKVFDEGYDQAYSDIFEGGKLVTVKEAMNYLSKLKDNTKVFITTDGVDISFFEDIASERKND